MSESRAKMIPLGSGLCAIVDERDYKWLREFAWMAILRKGMWYAARANKVEGAFGYSMTEYVFMHEAVASYRLGLKVIPEGTTICHENGNTLDNRLMADGNVQLRAIASNLKKAIDSGFVREISHGSNGTD